MKYKILAILVVVAVITACRKAADWQPADDDDVLAGGALTVFDEGSGAFTHSFNSLIEPLTQTHAIGDAAFENTFVASPAPIRPGLGPVFNNVSCASCHVADGRGKAPDAGESLVGMLIRLSIPGTDPHGGPNPAPGFGGQLQQRAIFGTLPEAGVQITYSDSLFTYPDGQTLTLRKPDVQLINPYQSLPTGLMISARVAPPVFGMGLLQAVPESEIVEEADEMDADMDGISGKANYVWDVLSSTMKLGRFGWKAGNPDVMQQSAGALNQDMGITNMVFPEESSYGQIQYDGRADEPEISDSLLYAIAFYMRTLAVPAARHRDRPEVTEGRTIFRNLGCVSCHRQKLHTGTDVAFPPVSNQDIYPYTDLLLHDMGPGLADHRPEFRADGSEWRTSPLWGIGLTRIVNGHTNFLHDGRARSLEEAILWHGGEAASAVQKFTQLNSRDRQKLLSFLNSL